VQLASQGLPERPDGIVCVAKYTTVASPDAKATEAEYERVARQNPATIFLRCFAEYENTSILLGQADVTVWPTFDIFYGGEPFSLRRPSDLTVKKFRSQQDNKFYLITSMSIGNRVARVEGNNHAEVEELLKRYQFQNTKLDLFSEDSPQPWGDGKARDPMRTPRTTARFLPGYDWDKDRGFFDDLADKAQSDFENQFGNWLPNRDDK
jgi:hypothetical protein